MGGIRLLIFQPALAPYRLHIYNELGKDCILKVIFLSENLRNQKFNQELLRKGLVVDCQYLTNGFTLFGRTLRLGMGREISDFRPDVVVTVEYSPATIIVYLLNCFRKKKFRHLIWTDDNPEYVSHERKIRRWLRAIILNKVDGLIVVSNEAETMYRNWFKAKCDIAVVPIIQKESVVAEQLAFATDRAMELRKQYGLMDRQVILFVGRLSPEKSVDRLIEAYAALRSAHNSAVLVLVGDGSERGNLEILARRLNLIGEIIFAGHCESVELAAWYRIGDLFVLPSSREPYGAVVNEALLAGMPVICSDKAGARELIVDGVNGEVVDASNRDTFCAALRRWILRIEHMTPADSPGPRESLMQVAFSTAVNNFLQLVKR